MSPDLDERRRILATPEVMTQIDGRHGGTDRRLIVQLRADLDDFIGGQPITVGGPRHRHAYMKPMVRDKNHRGFGGHEVWEIRSRDPKPGIRVFGRFAQPDVFVATNLEARTMLGAFGSLEWRREIRRCKHAWNAIFGTRQPLVGEEINDYVSEQVVDLRNP